MGLVEMSSLWNLSPAVQTQRMCNMNVTDGEQADRSPRLLVKGATQNAILDFCEAAGSALGETEDEDSTPPLSFELI